MQSRLDKITAPILPNIKAKDTPTSASQPPVLDEDRELRQINALDALLTNAYANKYPTPKTVRYPQSNPNHYDDLIKELDEAPTRTWAASLMMRLKGLVRMS